MTTTDTGRTDPGITTTPDVHTETGPDFRARYRAVCDLEDAAGELRSVLLDREDGGHRAACEAPSRQAAVDCEGCDARLVDREAEAIAAVLDVLPRALGLDGTPLVCARALRLLADFPSVSVHLMGSVLSVYAPSVAVAERVAAALGLTGDFRLLVGAPQWHAGATFGDQVTVLAHRLTDAEKAACYGVTL
jgi:hypothetical protein